MHVAGGSPVPLARAVGPPARLKHHLSGRMGPTIRVSWPSWHAPIARAARPGELDDGRSDHGVGAAEIYLHMQVGSANCSTACYVGNVLTTLGRSQCVLGTCRAAPSDGPPRGTRRWRRCMCTERSQPGVLCVWAWACSACMGVCVGAPTCVCAHMCVCIYFPRAHTRCMAPRARACVRAC